MKTLFFKRIILVLVLAGITAPTAQLQAMKRKIEESSKQNEKKVQKLEEKSVISIGMRKGLLTLLTGIEEADEKIEHDKILKYSDIMAEENQIINKDDFYCGWINPDLDEINMKDYHTWYFSKTSYFTPLLTSFRKSQYKKILIEWGVSTRYEKNLQDEKFCIKLISDDEIFDIADEMGSFIGFDKIANKTNEERKNAKPVKATENTTPHLCALVKKIAQHYNITTPEIFITHEFFSYTEHENLYLSVYESIFTTNDELCWTIAHELAHVYLNHGLETSKVNQKKYITTDNDINAFSRIQERAADTMALEITECPQAMLTSFLKRNIVRKLFGFDIPKDVTTHPSDHERMIFTHAYLKNNIQTNIFKNTERQDPISVTECLIC